jgi:quercetin dioxygenase-like cupin family protein
MEINRYFKNYLSNLSFQPDRYGKTTLFENEQILVGLNCLEPEQRMQKHAHVDQVRFYFVIEGTGLITVGIEEQNVSKGVVVWVPTGQPHQLYNNSPERLVLLVGITPSKAD